MKVLFNTVIVRYWYIYLHLNNLISLAAAFYITIQNLVITLRTSEAAQLQSPYCCR